MKLLNSILLQPFKRSFMSVPLLLILLSAEVFSQAGAQDTPTPTETPLCFQNRVEADPPALTPAPLLQGLAVNPYNNNVYVADSARGQIHVYEWSGGNLNYLKTLGTQDQYGMILEVAVGQDGLVYFTGDSPYVLAVDPATNGETYALTFDLPSNGRSIFVDKNGDIYAGTTFNGIVWFQRQPSCNGPVYDSGTSISLNGNPDPIDEVLGLLKTGSGPATLYVNQLGNQRINQYTQTGGPTGSVYQFAQTVGAGGELNAPIGEARDTAGYYYVVSNANGTIQLFDPGWNFVARSDYSVANCRQLGLDGIGGIYYINAVLNKLGRFQQGCRPLGAPPPTPAPTPNCIQASHTPTPAYPGSDPPKTGESFIYPSPAKGEQATVSYYMAETGGMELKIWNLNGELASTVRDRKSAGVQITSFNISRFAPGLYYYSVTLNYDSGRSESIKPRKFAIIR